MKYFNFSIFLLKGDEVDPESVTAPVTAPTTDVNSKETLNEELLKLLEGIHAGDVTDKVARTADKKRAGFLAAKLVHFYPYLIGEGPTRPASPVPDVPVQKKKGKDPKPTLPEYKNVNGFVDDTPSIKRFGMLLYVSLKDRIEMYEDIATRDEYYTGD